MEVVQARAERERQREIGVADEVLVKDACNGDEAAFNELYDRYFNRVFQFVNRRLYNRADVEETVQEVFINVYSAMASFRGEAPFGAWVLGVARRTVYGRYKKKYHPTISLDSDEGNGKIEGAGAAHSEEASPLEHFEAQERLASLKATAETKLSRDQLLLFELHHLQHRSIADIADTLNKSEDAVKSNLYRARKLLLAN